MVPACILATTYICIAETYRPVSERVSLLKFSNDVLPARIDERNQARLGVRVTIIASDVIEYAPLSVLSRACVSGNCIYYRKTCEAAAMRCDYSEGEPFNAKDSGRPLFIPERFSIQYRSQQALRDAEANIYLVVRPKGSPSYIPLTQLRTTAPDPSAVCGRNSKEPGCY